jgi:hypothetical protein
MKIELPVQESVCKSCGKPYGRPDTAHHGSHSYCLECANLPHDLMDILNMHEKQLARQAELAKGPVTGTATPEE